MPLLQFYTNPDQLTADEKQELVTTLTAFYARFMPDFFVNIVFNEASPNHLSHGSKFGETTKINHQQLPHGSFFMGGKPTDGNFVRFTADHIAVNWKKDSKRERSYLDWLGGVFKDRFEPKGWTWVRSPSIFWREVNALLKLGISCHRERSGLVESSKSDCSWSGKRRNEDLDWSWKSGSVGGNGKVVILWSISNFIS